MVPDPRHSGQVVTFTIRPKIDWETWRTSPCPWQVEHVWASLPLRWPLPEQVSQVISLLSLIFLLTPSAISSKGQLEGDLQVASALNP